MTTYLRRHVTWGVLAGLLIICGGFSVQAETASGVVFADHNANGVLDVDEAGIPSVSVSDGATVIQTDADGRFQLSLSEEARFIFVSTPSQTTAQSRWYQPVVEGKSDDYSFALATRNEEGPLVFVQLSDIHYAPTPEQFKEGLRDRRMAILPDPVLAAIAEDANALNPDFMIIAGDLAADSKYPEPSRVDEWIGAMADYASTFGCSSYAAVGNHDVIRDESIGKTIYESHFGPTYYSFNVKGTHIVVLDTQELQGTKLVYTVGAQQLAWLEQDLATVDPQVPILVFCHEPTFDWADTPENRALFTLLQRMGITALLNGHWHTNEILREEPFLEMTSGAVCGAWWESPGPDDTGFGYRVFRLARGNLDSIWCEGGEIGVEVSQPSRAVLTWADRLQAAVWGEMETATCAWDDGNAVALNVYWNGLWSSVSTNLNVSTLANGYHTMTITFASPDGVQVTDSQTYYISNHDIALAEIFDHADTYQGKIVAAPRLQVRAVMGSDISAFDETKTIIIGGFPTPVLRNDLIGLVGMYHPTSA